MSKLDAEQRAEVEAAINEVERAAKEARLINREVQAVLMEAVAVMVVLGNRAEAS